MTRVTRRRFLEIGGLASAGALVGIPTALGKAAPQPPLNMGHQVHHMGVALHIHELGNLNGAWFADPPDVITPQVEEHDVLSTLLLVPSKLLL